MGKIIIIGESHLDSIAELVTLHLMSHSNVKISALGLELPDNLTTIDETIHSLEKIVEEYSAILQKVSLDKHSPLLNEQLSTVEFMIQQVYQLQLKLEMLRQLKNFTFNFYAIDKVLQKLPEQDLQAVMTDPERDETMAAHIVDMAHNNEDISVVIVGQAHLEKLLPILNQRLTQEVLCVHCFSSMSYGDRVLTELLDKAPPTQTSWKDEEGIYHLDCRNKSIEEITDELLTISDTQNLSPPPVSSKKMISGEGALEIESGQSLNSLFDILRHKPSYTFTPEFYNNFLLEDYYEAISRDQPSKIPGNLQEFIDYLEIKHSPADPRLYHLYRLLALKQLGLTEDPLFKESLNILERLLNQQKVPRLGEALDQATVLAQQMVKIIILCKKGEETKDSAVKKINQLLDNYKELIENYMDEGITKEEEQILSEQMGKITQLKQFLPMIMQNVTKLNSLQLEMVQNVLSPPQHSFADEDSHESYYEAITYFSQGMLALHQLSSQPLSSDSNRFIIEHLTKAGELGFAQAYVELGHFYKKEGDFTKAFNNYLKAAAQGSKAGYANISLLLAEYQHEKPLAFFMSSALQFLAARSQKVNNNYNLDFQDLEFIDERQQIVANQLSTKIKNSVFRSSLEPEKEKSHFSLLSALHNPSRSNQFFRQPPYPTKLLDDFEAGLDFFLGQACQNLYRKDNGEFLCEEYASIATSWLNILDKYENPHERMIAVAMYFTEYCKNSPLDGSDPVLKFINLAVETFNNAMTSERTQLASESIENLKSGRKIAELDLTSKNSTKNEVLM
ncbi:sel1 repeat family protein [Legionella sp. PC1000]|uniref:sel1 repeat family protein n=1 Tax=Legionella sp. PC1000 TaxID=2746060 RepID=UPI0015FCC398|nr:sel1 repeat family protein [Legionella sp. PC1000]QLZ68486.1 sel1 repeat family protein [Legionella sp. PC1000]